MREKICGFILNILPTNESSPFKCLGRPLAHKYKSTIEKFSKGKATSLASNPNFHILLLGLKDIEEYKEFVELEVRSKENGKEVF